jgi:hypothetical protein
LARNPARIVNSANPEAVMHLAHRLVLALLIAVIEIAAFAVPLASVLLAYILLARPAWFRDWVDRLYRGVPRQVEWVCVVPRKLQSGRIGRSSRA